MPKGELVVYEGGPTDIAVARPPDVVLEEAHKAAKALMDVMGAKKKKVMMGGEQYLEFEDWQTVGRFYGVTVKVVSTEFIDYGGAKGFLAKAVVLRQDGAEISAAEAMCLNDEEKWSTRTKYDWKDVLDANGKMIWEPNPDKPGKSRPKREKVKVGEEAVPLFQLRSMAQTRACAKALRNVLAWVVVLAGYRPTPVEELDGMTETKEQESTPAAVVSPAPSEPKAPPASAPPSSAEGEKDEQTLRSELSQLADIAADAGMFKDRAEAVYAWTSYKTKEGKPAGYKDVSKLKKWQIEKALEKANADLNTLPPATADTGSDDDIPL